MRKPSIYSDRREGPDIAMTPMIDVVFLLLVFFLWTASFQVVEHILPSSVSEATGSAPRDPRQPPPPEEDFDQVVVRILWASGHVRWRMNEMDVGSLQQLHDKLKAIADIKRDAPVILHPDPNVPLGHVIDVYDLSRIVGFDKVQFATPSS